MSDEMPAKWKIRGLGDLRQPFLDFVFAEINLSSVGGGANVVGGNVFETAMSLTEAGSRFARLAARAMRARTSDSRDCSARESITTS